MSGSTGGEPRGKRGFYYELNGGVAMKGLSPKQEAFCMAYAKSGNATTAYKQAYPRIKNDKTAQACSSRLLASAVIQERLKAIREEIAIQA